MEYCTLGEMNVSRIIMGCMRIAGIPLQDVERVIIEAQKAGVNMFDLAEGADLYLYSSVPGASLFTGFSTTESGFVFNYKPSFFSCILHPLMLSREVDKIAQGHYFSTDTPTFCLSQERKQNSVSFLRHSPLTFPYSFVILSLCIRISKKKISI